MPRKKIFLFTFLLFIVGIISYSIYYVNDYYRADSKAISLMSNAKETNDYIYFEGSKTNIGVIIYPGGKVDEKSYSPLATKFSSNDIPTFIAKMPFHLSILSNDKASSIMNDFKDINSWIIIGHSLGGTSASIYASKNSDNIRGIVFLASFAYKDLSIFDIQGLSFVGNNDKILNLSNLEKYIDSFPKNTEFIEIEGGNHSNFGNYGFQKGDGIATISNEKQQQIVFDEVLKLIESIK